MAPSMDKKALYNLLGKYLNNTCTLDERSLIDEWLELLQDNRTFSVYTKQDLDVIHNRIWEKIQAQTNLSPEAKKPLNRRFYLNMVTRWGIAASIAGVLFFTAFKVLQNTTNSQQTDFAAIIPKSGMVKVFNTTNQPVRTVLEDGTIVLLEPNTTLNYPARFLPDKREVYLEGKAFFNVSKNAHRPFFIYHNNLVTHVLGTSFIINTRRLPKEAEVLVITGRVEVSENTQLINARVVLKTNGVVLTPNQKVVYVEDSRLFIPAIADKPLPLTKQGTNDFTFNDEEVGSVLSAISTEYAIEIVTENENINECTFTGNINDEDLYGKLDIICAAINASYEIKGTRILLKGKGCG